MGLINDTHYLAANVIQASTSSGNRRAPIKVALLSLPPRSQALLEFFFAHAGRGTFVATVEESAESAIFDLDTPSSKSHWERFHARTGLTGLALAVKAQEVPGAYWVQKPVTPATLMAAAAALRPPSFVATAIPPAPTPAPLDAPLPVELQAFDRTHAAEVTAPQVPAEPEPSAVTAAVPPVEPFNPFAGIPANTQPSTPAGAVEVAAHEAGRLVALPQALGRTTTEPSDADSQPPHFEAGSPDSAWADRFTAALRADPLLTHPESIVELEPARAEPTAPEQPIRRLVVKDPARSIRAAWNRWFGAPAKSAGLAVTPAQQVTAQPSSAEPVTRSPGHVGKASDARHAEVVDAVAESHAPPAAPTVAGDTDQRVDATADPLPADDHAPVPVPAAAAAREAMPAGSAATQAVSEGAEPLAPGDSTPPTGVTGLATEPATAVPEEPPSPVSTPSAAQDTDHATEPLPGPAPLPAAPLPGALPAVTDSPELFGTQGDHSVAEYASRHDLRYDPEAYLVGMLREASLIGAKWRVPTLIECAQGPLVIDASRNELHCGFDPSLLASAAVTPLLRRSKVRTLTSPEFARFKGEHDKHGAPLRLDNQLWLSAMQASAGRLPRGAQAQGTVYLLHWPCLTRLTPIPGSVRVAALWALRGGSVIDTAKQFGLPQRHVIAFYNGAWALDLLTDDGSHVQRALKRHARNRGLLTRLIGWLRR